ncbi:hypothetical protein B9479_005944 [Cryptococcus floricola]|uniref:BZIP domain-containing protein n=1 Tax=Cryptococcus floricola TaxID=2591691 RepID=A0A5D3APH5_9TREE|nr:hypothetical protein B9479_005944 [Cryptococcus floricola]
MSRPVSPTPPPQPASALASSLFQSDDGLIAYLQHNTDYSQDAAGNYTHNNPLAARSPSPPLPLPIPPSLNRLASNALSGFHSPALQPLPAPVDQAQVAAQMDYGDRGEMGGKRRKLPHQRAGWAEMEQQSGKKRRVSRKSTEGEGSPVPGQGHDGSPSSGIPQHPHAGHGDSPSHGAQDITSLTELSQMAINGQTAGGVDVGHVQEEPQIDPTLASAQEKEPVGPPPPPPEPPVDNSKLSRAEQNKRAQQAFRRRREEHMKKLEAESAQLQVVLRQCHDKDAVIKDLVMSQQTDKIRIAALETFIRQNATTHGTTPPFTGTGELNISEDLGFPHQSETGVSQDQLENAFQMLERQSRQVVKQLNRGQGL